MTLITLWWLLFWTALGLCVGSFLNAIIYRLPRNRSLRNPLWSACPHCEHRISWYDNLPVLSFILLRGRCRHCRAPIATRYLVIEISMALIVLMLLDAFFIGRVRAGLGDSPLGLTDQLWFDWDWPIFIAHITLFACLLPMSAIDIEHYWVDVRFTNFATITGFVLHGLWTPKHSMEWVRPFDTTAVMSLAAVIALGIVWIWLICRPHVDPADLEELEPEELPDAPTTPSSPYTRPPTGTSPSRAGGWIVGLLFLAMFVALWVDASDRADLPYAYRALPPLLLFFAFIVWEGTVVRPSDRHIADAIYQERRGARRMVLSEFAMLLPVVIAAVIAWWVMARTGDLSDGIRDALHGEPPNAGLAVLRGWRPLFGLATAASGYVIAGALGWTIRIVFTLVFGREAFGSGDIHLMAAAGCIAGWPVVVLGFFLTCGLAMVGWLAALPFKRTRALPLGPWLTLSFLIVVLFYDSIVAWPIVGRVLTVANLLFFENSQIPTFESLLR